MHILLAKSAHGGVVAKKSGQASSVLVVEDDADTSEALTTALADELGGRAAVAYDGDEALRMATDMQPSVVLLDIGLPKRDGYEVARALRADPRTADTWVVALTATGTPREAANAGFDQYLWKPADISHVRVAVVAGLARRRLRIAQRTAEAALGLGGRPLPEVERLAEKLSTLVDRVADGSESDVATMLAEIQKLLAE